MVTGEARPAAQRVTGGEEVGVEKGFSTKRLQTKTTKKVSLHLFYVGIETIKYIETALCRNKGLFNKFWKMKFCKETTYLDIRNEKEKRTVSARRIRTSEAGRQKAGWPSLLEWKGK